MTRPLILASSSPRRLEILREAGFVFEVDSPDIDETALADESPEDQARRLAEEKAQAVAVRTAPDVCVLAADTMVVIDGRILGKPQSEEEAVEMLRALAGREHRVLTGYALLISGSSQREIGLEESAVRMHPVSLVEARRYAAGGEPMDKAGAYAVQGDGGRFVAGIVGLRSNVIGLPIEALQPRLAAFGVVPARQDVPA